MKRLVLISLMILATSVSFAQRPEQGEYRHKIDSLEKEKLENFEWHNATIPVMYREIRDIEARIDSLTAVKDSLSSLRDSLGKLSDEKRIAINEEINQTRKRYVLYSEDALYDTYSMKGGHTRDSLETILKNLSPKVRKSKAAKRLDQYLHSDYPVLTGTLFRPFKCYTLEGKKYDWSHIKGKKTLIILDGFYCMNPFDATAAGKYFREICRKAGDGFALVPVIYAADIEEMKMASDRHKIGDLNPVSDLEGELSELMLIYQAKGTPTTIYVDENGTIVHYELGLDTVRLEKFVGAGKIVD